MMKRILLSAFVMLLAVGTTMAQQFEAGKVRIKFKQEMTAQLDGIMAKEGKEMGRTLQARNGFVQMGIADVDGVNQMVQAVEMTRVFRPAGKFEARHRAWGLHLWYEVKFNSQAELKEIMSAYGSLAMVETAERVNVYSLNDGYDATAEAVNTLENLAPMSIPGGTPNDPSYSSQWGFPAINAAQAWEIETGNSSVVVAIEDGGVDVNHEDLAGNMWVNTGEIAGNGVDDDNNGYVDDYNGYNFGDNGGAIPGDDHGSHVGGTVAAETNNGIGVSGTAGGSGSNDGVRLMSLSVFGATSQGGFDEAFIYAADMGAAISQNSWGGGAQSSVLENAIDYFRANGGGTVMNGGLVVFAAGNDNSSSASRGYPGSYASCLAVASTTSSDARSSFSNYGSWVDIAAPGSAIYSTFPNDTYSSISGTSMACPHVSGVAALVLSNKVDSGLTITDDELWNIVVGSANYSKLYDANGSYTGQLGSGLLDAYAALTGQIAPPPPAPACEVSGTSDVTLNLLTDNYGSETSWTLQDTLGNTLASGSGYANNTSYTETFTGITGHLIFTLYDSYGDGICCAYGSGSYSLVDGDGTTLASGGSFGGSEQTVMCIDGDGGGGPVDPPVGDSTVLVESYFESGWDGWVDGGEDCNRYTRGARSYEGNASIRIRDNSGEASAMSYNGVDASSYDEVKVDFYFYVHSFENSEDFWVRYYDGSSWSTVATFVNGTDFTNGNFYNATVTIPGALSANSGFRFQCDASGNGDHIYIDQVTITGYTGAQASLASTKSIQQVGQPMMQQFAQTSLDDVGMNLYPNPAQDVLNIALTGSSNATVNVISLSGQHIVRDLAVQGTTTLDVSTLPAGVYMVQLIAEDEVVVKRFIKK